jgi:hypothetical protein
MKKLILCLALTGLFTAAINISSAMPVKLNRHYSLADSSEYQKFKAGAKQQIQDNEKRIARFRDKMSTKTDEARASLKVKVDTLEAKNRRLDNELAQYKEDAKGDWRTFKQKFNNEMDKLKKSFDDVKNDMK